MQRRIAIGLIGACAIVWGHDAAWMAAQLMAPRIVTVAEFDQAQANAPRAKCMCTISVIPNYAVTTTTGVNL